jgi:hypothetical protein
VNDFDTFIAEHQVAWRANNIDGTEEGTQNGVQRPWILPAVDWELGLWPDLRSDGRWPVGAYLDKHQVQRHTGSHNLKSSWVSGVNFYFPFGQLAEGRDLLASFLQRSVDSRIKTVDSVELEYAEEGSLSPAALLGEGGGSRGSGQTSPDIGVLVNDGTGLLLIENKLTEHSFYPCSARTKTGSVSRPANPDAARCANVSAIIRDPEAQCHQQAWGRKYWGLLSECVDVEKIAQLTCCPAARSGYQLLRQQALAEGIAASGKYDFVVSCVALDDRNDTLRHSMSATGIAEMAAWGDYFRGKATFRTFSHQDWFAWVESHDADAVWDAWRAWVGCRYDVAGTA